MCSSAIGLSTITDRASKPIGSIMCEYAMLYQMLYFVLSIGIWLICINTVHANFHSYRIDLFWPSSAFMQVLAMHLRRSVFI